MTGSDHDADALIAALRSPALPSEGAGEGAAVSAMLEAVSTAPTRSARHRSRRGVTIAAVTVASLGVGGLVAAGPGGFFFPAADRAPADESTTTSVLDRPGSSPDDPTGLEATSPGIRPAPTSVTTSTVAGVATGGDTPTDDCDAATHGDTVSEVARSSEPGEVRDAARSNCGEPDTSPGDTPASTAPGRTGETPASTAPGLTGETPASTAPGLTGETPASSAPGLTGETPASTAPGQPDGNAPADTASIRADGASADRAPAPTPDDVGRP